MVKISVMYAGQPADPPAFDAYYWGTHLPTVEKWPRIRRITLAKGGPGDEFYQIADLLVRLAGRPRRRARVAGAQGVGGRREARFPEFRGQIKRQVFEIKAYWP